MMRVSAYIVSRNGDVYDVETRIEGVETPCKFSITAKSEDEAAFAAIRRTETMNDALVSSIRTN